ncbi:polysaccharide pyruvyl transferase family protein [uncultured Bacteroides sp.]|uniref:polysaccharide pyruvyl transferase family protein n=1 Tax=uncultured Bacteroides sp. TaxID=162156 RepID=UPI002AAC0086|nr:polysaccharide pyruvyl transferase family protein [uncultured Bacteroides sp.]
MNHVVISGFNLEDNNRGTAALGYGSISFLSKFHDLSNKKIACVRFFKKPWKCSYKPEIKEYFIDNKKVDVELYKVWYFEYLLIKIFKVRIPFFPLSKLFKDVEYVAAINGGDGFSDIYGKAIFENRLKEINIAMTFNIPLIILPQTLGPFKDNRIYLRASNILKYSTKVYVRDKKFDKELNQMGVRFNLTKDLSFYMQPEMVNIKLKPNAIGLNISGLAYSNKFYSLANQFDNYPILIDAIINYFQKSEIPIYLISHSYNFLAPEANNDDLQVCKQVYENLNNKHFVYVINENFTPPQIKYIISQMDFFIGTRMHANFAAIFTKTPVFGLSYSYKFAGAFDSFGLNDSYSEIRNLSKNDIFPLISKIENFYLNKKTKVIIRS